VGHYTLVRADFLTLGLIMLRSSAMCDCVIQILIVEDPDNDNMMYGDRCVTDDAGEFASDLHVSRPIYAMSLYEMKQNIVNRYCH